MIDSSQNPEVGTTVPARFAVAAGGVELEHEPVSAVDVVSGAPSVGSADLMEFAGAAIGVWEITPGVVTDTEVDEVFVVLSGSGSVELLDSGATIPLGAGTVVRLIAGERTRWRIDSTLRKIYIIRSDESAPAGS